MRSRLRLACGAFSYRGKGQRRSARSKRLVLRPSSLCFRHPRGPLSNHSCRLDQNGALKGAFLVHFARTAIHSCKMDQIAKPRGVDPETDAAYRFPQMRLIPPRLGTVKLKLVHATKITLIYLRKVQNVLSFLPFSQPPGRKLSTPSVPPATPPTARSRLW